MSDSVFNNRSELGGEIKVAIRLNSEQFEKELDRIVEDGEKKSVELGDKMAAGLTKELKDMDQAFSSGRASLKETTEAFEGFIRKEGEFLNKNAEIGKVVHDRMAELQRIYESVGDVKLDTRQYNEIIGQTKAWKEELSLLKGMFDEGIIDRTAFDGAISDLTQRFQELKSLGLGETVDSGLIEQILGLDDPDKMTQEVSRMLSSVSDLTMAEVSNVEKLLRSIQKNYEKELQNFGSTASRSLTESIEEALVEQSLSVQTFFKDWVEEVQKFEFGKVLGDKKPFEEAEDQIVDLEEKIKVLLNTISTQKYKWADDHEGAKKLVQELEGLDRQLMKMYTVDKSLIDDSLMKDMASTKNQMRNIIGQEAEKQERERLQNQIEIAKKEDLLNIERANSLRRLGKISIDEENKMIAAEQARLGDSIKNNKEYAAVIERIQQEQKEALLSQGPAETSVFSDTMINAEKEKVRKIYEESMNAIKETKGNVIDKINEINQLQSQVEMFPELSDRKLNSQLSKLKKELNDLRKDSEVGDSTVRKAQFKERIEASKHAAQQEIYYELYKRDMMKQSNKETYENIKALHQQLLDDSKKLSDEEVKIALNNLKILEDLEKNRYKEGKDFMLGGSKTGAESTRNIQEVIRAQMNAITKATEEGLITHQQAIEQMGKLSEKAFSLGGDNQKIAKEVKNAGKAMEAELSKQGGSFLSNANVFMKSAQGLVVGQVFKTVVEIGSKIKEGFIKVEKDIGDLQLLNRRFEIIFKENSLLVSDWVNDFSSEFGKAKSTIQRELTDVSDMLMGFGVKQMDAFDLSTDFVKLMNDYSLYFGVSMEEVSRRVNSAIMGEYRGMKKMTVNVNKDLLDMKAKLAGLGDDFDALPEEKRTRIILEVMEEQSPHAKGFLEDNQDLINHQANIRREQSKQFWDEMKLNSQETFSSISSSLADIGKSILRVKEESKDMLRQTESEAISLGAKVSAKFTDIWNSWITGEEQDSLSEYKTSIGLLRDEMKALEGDFHSARDVLSQKLDNESYELMIKDFEILREKAEDLRDAQDHLREVMDDSESSASEQREAKIDLSNATVQLNAELKRHNITQEDAVYILEEHAESVNKAAEAQREYEDAITLAEDGVRKLNETLEENIKLLNDTTNAAIDEFELIKTEIDLVDDLSKGLLAMNDIQELTNEDKREAAKMVEMLNATMGEEAAIYDKNTGKITVNSEAVDVFRENHQAAREEAEKGIEVKIQQKMEIDLSDMEAEYREIGEVRDQLVRDLEAGAPNQDQIKGQINEIGEKMNILQDKMHETREKYEEEAEKAMQRVRELRQKEAQDAAKEQDKQRQERERERERAAKEAERDAEKAKREREKAAKEAKRKREEAQRERERKFREQMTLEMRIIKHNNTMERTTTKQTLDQMLAYRQKYMNSFYKDNPMELMSLDEEIKSMRDSLIEKNRQKQIKQVDEQEKRAKKALDARKKALDKNHKEQMKQIKEARQKELKAIDDVVEKRRKANQKVSDDRRLAEIEASMESYRLSTTKEGQDEFFNLQMEKEEILTRRLEQTAKTEKEKIEDKYDKRERALEAHYERMSQQLEKETELLAIKSDKMREAIERKTNGMLQDAEKATSNYIGKINTELTTAFNAPLPVNSKMLEDSMTNVIQKALEDSIRNVSLSANNLISELPGMGGVVVNIGTINSQNPQRTANDINNLVAKAVFNRY